jgi:hypothetical protein
MASEYGLIKVQEIVDLYKSEKDKFTDHDSLKIITFISRGLNELKFVTPSMPVEKILTINSNTLTAAIPVNASRIYGVGRLLNNQYIPLVEGNLSSKGNLAEYTVGQDLGFGIVAQVLADKYIIAAKDNIGKYQFGKIITSVDKGVGYQGVDVDFVVGVDEIPRTNSYDGVFNTSLIIESASQMTSINATITDDDVNTYNYAAYKCAEYSIGGYSNWYLPSKDELREYLTVKGLDSKSYITSTEYETTDPLVNAYLEIYAIENITAVDIFTTEKTSTDHFVLPFMELEKGLTELYTPSETSFFDNNIAKNDITFKIFLDEGVIRFSKDPEKNLVIRYESNKFDNSAFIPQIYTEAILAFIDWKMASNMNEKLMHEKQWKEQVHLIQRHSLPSILRMYKDILQEWRMSDKMSFRNDLH